MTGIEAHVGRIVGRARHNVVAAGGLVWITRHNRPKGPRVTSSAPHIRILMHRRITTLFVPASRTTTLGFTRRVRRSQSPENILCRGMAPHSKFSASTEEILIFQWPAARIVGGAPAARKSSRPRNRRVHLRFAIPSSLGWATNEFRIRRNTG